MKTLLVAIHGIMTNQTDPSWPDKLDAWMFEHAPDIKVLKKEYRAGPFPKWNCWVKDPALAKSLANEVELFLLHGADPDESRPAIWFVAHSNGAVIALLTVKILIQRGHKIAGIILTGAACEADVARNGVEGWLDAGVLGCAVAYISPEDEVLPGPDQNHSAFRRLYSALARPYGSLGRTGWRLDGVFSVQSSVFRGDCSDRLITRAYPGGHSTYFSAERIEATFEQILSDIRRFSTTDDTDSHGWERNAPVAI